MEIDINIMRPVESTEPPGDPIAPLFKDAREAVQVETWAAGASINVDRPNGAELLELSGECVE